MTTTLPAPAPATDVLTGHPAPGHDLLRLATAGSVDDGKSTLVGRLLYDTKSVLTDQLDAVERVSRDRGLEAADLALLTDGLRAEREQGITIDVAYRYFSTATRSYVLADTPGHVQYTRNMVTGASTAELALILVDARHGVVEQTRRHLAVTGLLGVRHVALAVNKMDLVGWDEATFAAIVDEFSRLADRFGIADVVAVPVSALLGDNIVQRSLHTPWYAGPTLLEHLEAVPVGTNPALEPLRLPVQYVVRPRTAAHPDYRGYASCGPGTRSWSCPPAAARRWPGSTAPARPARSRPSTSRSRRSPWCCGSPTTSTSRAVTWSPPPSHRGCSRVP